MKHFCFRDMPYKYIRMKLLSSLKNNRVGRNVYWKQCWGERWCYCIFPNIQSHLSCIYGGNIHLCYEKIYLEGINPKFDEFINKSASFGCSKCGGSIMADFGRYIKKEDFYNYSTKEDYLFGIKPDRY